MAVGVERTRRLFTIEEYESSMPTPRRSRCTGHRSGDQYTDHQRPARGQRIARSPCPGLSSRSIRFSSDGATGAHPRGWRMVAAAGSDL